MNSSTLQRFNTSTATIVTAASSNHFGCLQNLLWTISRCAPTARVIAWDLGLQPEESALLNNLPPFYLADWQLRTFDFTKYPPHFDMAQNGGRMAFRPTVIAQAAQEMSAFNPPSSFLLWLDAGCQLRGTIWNYLALIKTNGVYCAATQGIIGERLFPTAHAPLNVTPDLLNKPIRDAGICGFDIANPKAMALIQKWSQVALDPNCTAPEGSTKKTHRQDAVFAVLLHQAGMATDHPARGIIMRRDNLTLAETKFRCRA